MYYLLTMSLQHKKYNNSNKHDNNKHTTQCIEMYQKRQLTESFYTWKSTITLVMPTRNFVFHSYLSQKCFVIKTLL